MSSSRRNVLVLDGGGEPLGQLLILRNLMDHILKQSNPQPCTDAGEMRPSDYFELIIGSGRCGVIAVYLGRFKLTLDECKECYEEFVKESFILPRGLFSLGNYLDQRVNAWRLKKISTDQARKYGARDKGKTILLCPKEQPNSQRCKVAVIMLNGHNIEGGTVLRSWVPREDAGLNPLITEVFHATCTTTGLLPPIIVRGASSRDFGQRLLAGTLHLHNPAKFACPELEKACPTPRSGPKPAPTAIISIGTEPPFWDLEEHRHSVGAKAMSLWNVLLGRSIPTVPLVSGLSKVSNDTNSVHNDMLRDFPRESGIYYRFESPRYEPTFPSRRASQVAAFYNWLRVGAVGLPLILVSHFILNRFYSFVASNVVVPSSLVDLSSRLVRKSRWLVKLVVHFSITLFALRHTAYLYDQTDELDSVRQKSLKDEIDRRFKDESESDWGKLQEASRRVLGLTSPF